MIFSSAESGGVGGGERGKARLDTAACIDDWAFSSDPAAGTSVCGNKRERTGRSISKPRGS